MIPLWLERRGFIGLMIILVVLALLNNVTF
jgi:hypothetical protein